MKHIDFTVHPDELQKKLTPWFDERGPLLSELRRARKPRGDKNQIERLEDRISFINKEIARTKHEFYLAREREIQELESQARERIEGREDNSCLSVTAPDGSREDLS